MRMIINSSSSRRQRKQNVFVFFRLPRFIKKNLIKNPTKTTKKETTVIPNNKTLMHVQKNKNMSIRTQLRKTSEKSRATKLESWINPDHMPSESESCPSPEVPSKRTLETLPSKIDPASASPSPLPWWDEKTPARNERKAKIQDLVERCGQIAKNFIVMFPPWALENGRSRNIP